MQNRILQRILGFTLLAVLVTIGGSHATFAATTSNSPNYMVTETQFGAGGTLESCSGQYCAQASIGDPATGGRSVAPEGGSTAQFGTITNSEPLLEVIIDEGESNLGVLSTERTATKTTTVRVRNYLSGGYVLQIMGDPPKYGNHSLYTPSTPTESTMGTEQFGMNAVANTQPSVGANPVQVPSSAMSFGKAALGYDTPNLFKYVSGDTVMRSDSESGQTDFTVTMIVNVSELTPAGHYSGQYSAIVTPSY